MAVSFAKDNGIGFDMKFERRIFGLFERLNFLALPDPEVEGTQP